MEEVKRKKHIFKDNIQTLVIGGITVFIVLFLLIYNNINTSKTYTVVNGHVEKISDLVGYVLKDESVISIDNNISAIPVVEQGKRVFNNEIIAIYKNDKYDEYLAKVDALDKEIQTLIVDLPETYSNDINNINDEISKLTKEATQTTSYVKMQEYKKKIDDLAYKKVSILGNLSPAGSKIRELIEQRESLEENSKNLGNSINATRSGIVTYKIDGLENVINYNDILKYNETDLDNIILHYSNNNTNNFGIKIIDNFKCYLLVKEKRGENDKYIKEGRKYNIKLTDNGLEAISCTLEKNIETDEYNYSIFSISNSIENFVDNRTLNVEVVWTSVEGKAVPKNAMYRNDEKGYDFVTIVTGGEYTNIPVKIVISSDNMCIVENYEEEELQSLGIEDTVDLNVYDMLLASSN